ncbi:hypothetical protein [Inconstantimicrobium mannanitabidum]|uniref:Uncharacterized protein n=1 Tax=Inconstantimicrobium mannanitabidum TaxID=1604901 RepID=A0ACB5R9E4_9CLOT|nr:hypothetical protein [Clostridium sp. TW13]GKX65638.1 hypothetical protein rsdtw13_08960 [Clostridium sp. TW13]
MFIKAMAVIATISTVMDVRYVIKRNDIKKLKSIAAFNSFLLCLFFIGMIFGKVN